MSILSQQVVADVLARTFTAVVNPAPKAAVRFPEIPGITSQIGIPTRYGDASATVYQPQTPTAKPPVYLNVHGGGFVIGHREQDDPCLLYTSPSPRDRS